MAAMQTELVQTMEMLEKMYNGWQTSLEEALTEVCVQRDGYALESTLLVTVSPARRVSRVAPRTARPAEP